MNTTAVAILSEAGIRGMDAESALRCILAELAAPSGTSREIFRKLGLDASQLDPSNHRIGAIVRRLAEAGLEDESARRIFPDRCAAEMMVLVKHVGRFDDAS